MINCQHARHLFDSYLDGELSASLQTELHAHRLNCSACQNELALLEACGDVVAMDRREPQMSASFTDRVMLAHRGQRLPKQRRWGRTLWLVGSPMAAAASIAFMFLMVAPRNNHGPHTAVLGGVVAVPEGHQKALQDPNHPLSPDAQRELDNTPRMADDTFDNAVQAAANRVMNFGRSTAEWKQVVTGLPSTNEKLTALFQSVQKAPGGGPAERVGTVDLADPSDLIQLPAAPDPVNVPDEDSPSNAV